MNKLIFSARMLELNRALTIVQSTSISTDPVPGVEPCIGRIKKQKGLLKCPNTSKSRDQIGLVFSYSSLRTAVPRSGGDLDHPLPFNMDIMTSGQHFTQKIWQGSSNMKIGIQRPLLAKFGGSFKPIFLLSLKLISGYCPQGYGKMYSKGVWKINW